MIEAGEVELFGDEDEPSADNRSAKKRIEITSRELIGLIANELNGVATAIDQPAPWPLSAMSAQNLVFLQSLDRRAQHLRECSKLLEAMQAQGTADSILTVDSSLDAIASLLSQRGKTT